jgi:hypothetical protein
LIESAGRIRRNGRRYAPFGVVVEQGSGHLGAAGVVHAHKQHLGHVGHGDSFVLGGGVAALAREPRGQHRQVGMDRGSRGELVEGVVHNCGHRLGGEDPVEPVGECGGFAVEQDLHTGIDEAAASAWPLVAPKVAMATAIGSSKLFTGEGMDTLVENGTTCCYVLQDKVWVHGPGKEPWEV